MAKHTEGSVHLTSLSLDLTQFNENIQQIQNSTAEVADIAVQNLNKIQEALNVPVEQMRLSMDTSQIAQDMSRAQASVEGLRNAFGTVSKEIQGGQLFSSKSFDDLVEALHLTGNEASVAHDKLKTLLSSLNEYDKVSISASGGKLLQAVITSTDEAGAKIQNVIDLTKKLDDKFLEGSISISDNAEKRNAALEQQNARIKKSNNALADSLIRIISQYEKLGREINRSDLSDVVKADFLQDITTAENQIKGLQEEIRVMNQTMSNSELSSRLDPFNIQLENIAVNFGKAKQTQKEFLTDADKQISKISTQYEQLATNIEKSDLSNLVKKDLLSRIKEAQTNMQNLANDVAEVSSIAQKGDYDKEFGNISIQLKNISEDFGKAKEAQKEFLAGEKRVEDLSQDYAQLQNRLAGLVYSMTSSKIDTPEMGASIANAKNLAIEMANVANAVRNSDTITEGAKSTFNNFADAVLRLELNLKAIKTSNAEYKKSLQPVQQTVQETISSLKTLEKTAVFKTSKDQVAALRAKYEEFLQTLKNTNISVDDAEKELADLQKQFNELETTVKRGNGTLENWVNKITESAKWQIANSALNLLQQSFGQLTDTIITTESSIIELKRVLNDKSLVDSEMSKALYDIAYEYGQTFENVQEVAIRFAQTGKTWDETLNATRATMLGLNTAELEVSTATEGLIAVMSQFDVQAGDLEKVIDKINITADNFPVTSEKIVAALQRAGGTADAFNMTLEETIATITALAEKTGRSGENIGTALNSLIIFTNKSENLKLFSSLSQEMDNVVKRFQSGAGSIIDVWQQLSVEISRLSKDQEDALFNSTAFEEFASQFEAEAAEYAGTIQQIYGTAGAYRRNYLTVLLQDMSTVDEALATMTGAIGYSLQENETAMEAFSKKWNQLIISAKELAVQFGEAGFLDTMKLLVDISSYVLSLTKNIGGLNTILGATTAIILYVKKQKLVDGLSKISGLFRTGSEAISIYNATLATTASRSAAVSAATAALKISMGDVIAIAGLAVTGVSMAITAYKDWQEEMIKAREEAINTGKEASGELKTLGIAYKEYSDALESGNNYDISESRKKLAEYLGIEISNVEILVKQNKDLVKGYEDVDAALRTLLKDKYAEAQIDVATGYDNLLEKMAEVEGKANEILNATTVGDPIALKLQEDMDMWQDILDALTEPVTPDNLEENYKTLGVTLQFVSENFTDAQIAESGLAKAMDEHRTSLEGWVVELENWANEQNAVSGGFDEWLEYIANGGYAMDDAADKTNNASTALVDFQTNLDNTSKSIDSLNQKVDSFQSAYKTLTEIIDEYNETGKLSADNLQTLMGLEPEYIQLLDIKNGTMSINKERLDDLIQANDQYLDNLAILRTAEEIDTILKDAQAASTAGLTVEQYKAQVASQVLATSTYQLVKQLYDGEISADQFKGAIKDAANNAGIAAGYMDTLTNSIWGTVDAYSAFYNVQRNVPKYNMAEAQMWGFDDPSSAEFIKFMEQRNVQTNLLDQQRNTLERYIGSGTGSKTSSGGSKSATDKYKEEKDALNELLEVYEHSIFLIEKNEKDSAKAGTEIAAIYKKMQDEVHAQAERYRAQGVSENDELIRNLQEKWKQTTTYIRKEYRAA